MSPARRPLQVASAVIVLAQAVAITLIVGAGARARVVFPVEIVFPARRLVFAEVDVAAAVVTLLVGVAAFRVLAVVRPARGSTVRWIEFSLTASVTVFLVAQLNGIHDIAALVPLYALASTPALFGLLQDRSVERTGHRMLPLAFGAAVGIVPWGVIAFTEVAAIVVGEPPSTIVRVVTLTMLAAGFAFAVWQWRAGGRESVHVVLTVVSTSVFAWLVVLGVVLPGVS
jgi:hypothetical protein